MARKSKYTPEERKELNRLRSRIYYYKQKLSKLETEMRRSELVPTISDIRNLLSDEEAYDLSQSGIFNDPDKYYNQDFRDVLLDAGYTAVAERVSELGDYGSLEDYLSGGDNAYGEQLQAIEDKIEQLQIKYRGLLK